MANSIRQLWDQAKFPSAFGRAGGKALELAGPGAGTYLANRLFSDDRDAANSAAITAMGTQGALNLGRLAKNQITLRQPRGTLDKARTNLQGELTKAGIKSPGDMLPEHTAHAKDIKTLDNLGIKYSPEYAAALQKPPQNRTPQEHQMVLESGKLLGHDPMNHINEVSAAATSHAALKAKMAPVERAGRLAERSQQHLDAMKAGLVPGNRAAGTRNALIGAGAGLASTPALNAVQTGVNAMSSEPRDPNAKAWAGAPYRAVRDTAATAASRILGPPKPDTGLPWDKIALGGGAAALLAALLYKVMGKDKAEEDDSEEEG